MEDPDKIVRDYTMQSRRWSGEKLITAQIAVEIARLVHRQTYGQSDIEANEPLKVVPQNDEWIVSGSKQVPFNPIAIALDGPLEMRISQYDGQIVSYLVRMTLSRADPASK